MNEGTSADPIHMTGSVRLRPLTLVDEGDDVLVGDPETGTFITVPMIGGVVIRALQQGATIDEAAVEAARHAGEPVDVASFVAGLRDIGFVAEDTAAQAEPPRTAPIQHRRWLTGPAPQLVRPLFSRAAWCCYAAAAFFCLICFAFRTDLRPKPADVFIVADQGLSMLLLIPFVYLTTGLHEVWHWLAARSLGLTARFGVDRRLYFLVFETDLSQLWSVPRSRRFGPQLAGLAIDSTVIALLLVVKLLHNSGWYTLPPVGFRIVSALIFTGVASVLWQCMIFMRTDLYGVMVTAMGCRNLWRIKDLSLLHAFGRLSEKQKSELGNAHPNDARTARWFRWVYLGGLVIALLYFAVFYVPILAELLRWSVHGLAQGPLRLHFWTTLIASILLYTPLLLPPGLQISRLLGRAAKQRQ
ncbi:hypothetical protein ACIBI9_45375 [Nonomuraea sp. NPDC050451]|uniref:hypothetical protein n=1 Tax=Nonomuraea sp. NPDC050451 TaxID=3364364 RepID=UPI00379A366B